MENIFLYQHVIFIFIYVIFCGIVIFMNMSLSHRLPRIARRVRPYASRSGSSITLKNSNVILICNAKKYTMSCIDCRVRNHTAVTKQSAIDENGVIITGGRIRSDNIFEISFRMAFNTVCEMFDDRTTFEQIVNMLSVWLSVEVYDPITKNTKFVSESSSVIALPTWLGAGDLDKYESDLTTAQNEPLEQNGPLIDLNTASEEDITGLPGISVVMAKRIIKYRESKGGFTSMYEFFSVFKIKEHFQKQLSSLVTVENKVSGPQSVDKPVKRISNDRIIDF